LPWQHRNFSNFLNARFLRYTYRFRVVSSKIEKYCLIVLSSTPTSLAMLDRFKIWPLLCAETSFMEYSLFMPDWAIRILHQNLVPLVPLSSNLQYIFRNYLFARYSFATSHSLLWYLKIGIPVKTMTHLWIICIPHFNQNVVGGFWVYC
jgi:hypothetical protein